LATASYDKIARWWDVHEPHNPSLLNIFTDHTDAVFSVAFSPDGHTLATGSADKTALLWETDVENVAARVCRMTSHITEDEWRQYLPDFPYQPPCLQDARVAGK
ncbi:MAG: WD40 repeat domain-containing protein, partial [Pseudonocardiaceae bacterium]